MTLTRWTVHRQALRPNRGETLRIVSDERALTFGEVISGWRADKAFRDLFIAELAATSYGAFFWEMPPVSQQALSAAFECAMICSEALADLGADDSDFAEHLAKATGTVASFVNLGGDAVLIVPKRISAVDCYAHIAAFLREGPREQQHALFQCVATEAEKLLARREKFWISTSGLGVPWLHVRLDSHPKYYQHRPYAER